MAAAIFLILCFVFRIKIYEFALRDFLCPFAFGFVINAKQAIPHKHNNKLWRGLL
jgi:hypothetical protein